jgi:hypothetical protein
MRADDFKNNTVELYVSAIRELTFVGIHDLVDRLLKSAAVESGSHQPFLFPDLSGQTSCSVC